MFPELLPGTSVVQWSPRVVVMFLELQLSNFAVWCSTFCLREFCCYGDILTTFLCLVCVKASPCNALLVCVMDIDFDTYQQCNARTVKLIIVLLIVFTYHLVFSFFWLIAASDNVTIICCFFSSHKVSTWHLTNRNTCRSLFEFKYDDNSLQTLHSVGSVTQTGELRWLQVDGQHG